METRSEHNRRMETGPKCRADKGPRTKTGTDAETRMRAETGSHNWCRAMKSAPPDSAPRPDSPPRTRPPLAPPPRHERHLRPRETLRPRHGGPPTFQPLELSRRKHSKLSYETSARDFTLSKLVVTTNSILSTIPIRILSRGVLLNCNSRWCVTDPLARSASRLPLTRGEINTCNVRVLFSPSVRGRAAEGGRGSLTHHRELGVGQHARRHG